MQLMRSSCLFALVACAVLPQSTPAVAALAEWFTETAVSDDGQYILVTINDRSMEVELSDSRLDARERERARFVRTTYPKCGLYRNDGSNTLLWTYDGRWSDDPIIAPDGEHVIFPGSWTWNKYEELAVDFTRRGRTIRSYYNSDFIPAFWLKCLVNGRRQPTCNSVSFDAAKMTYTIRTNQREEFVFDVTTGEIVDIRSPFTTYYAVAVVAFAAVIALAIVWLRQKKLAARGYSGTFGSCRR